MRLIFTCAWSSALGVLLLAGPTHAETSRPATERFTSASVEEVPDFQKHVVPLLGRLGCNGRACHGSFQGRGGFRLSLFGYDFQDGPYLADGAVVVR